MWQILKHTVTPDSVTQHCSFLLTSSFLELFPLFFSYFSSENIPSWKHIVLSCSASLQNKSPIGCSLAVVILFSSNQSFRQLLLHLPPCFYSSLSSPLPPSPKTCLSCGTCFYGCLCWQHVDLSLYFLSFLKVDRRIMSWKSNSNLNVSQ